ncbi:MAG: ion transporter [Clostridiales bacterium]|nr:ion transporter [Clostridiales bacterium]
MKKKRRLPIAIILVIIFLYITLLLLLMRAEANEPLSSIDTFIDALWYSVATLTTVGYGDITPVTPVGRAVGTVFVLLSTGILVTLISTLLSFLTSEGFPLFRLSFLKRKDWYYFADASPESITLAGQILRSEPHAVIIYGLRKNQIAETPDYPCLFINASPERIAQVKGNIGNQCCVFFMKENDIGVNTKAANISRLPVKVYARTVSGEEKLSGNIHFFHSYECCAREYWRQKPLLHREHRIVLLGFGHYGEALLKYAILTNVLSPDHHVAYHIFGTPSHFLDIHENLKFLFSVQEEASDRDSILFHTSSWTANHELLASADRVIICCDDEQEGWDMFWHLRRYYRISGRIDLRSSRFIPDVSHFGVTESIYTPEHVLRTTLNQVAIAMNDLYRNHHPQNALNWDSLSDYLRQSKISASEHLFVKVRILLQDETLTLLTPETLSLAYAAYQRNIQDKACLDLYRQIEHLRWLRFYLYHNWSRGPIHSQTLRQDPRLCPYEELTPQAKAYGDYSWELLSELELKSAEHSNA